MPLRIARITKTGDNEGHVVIDWGNAAILGALFTLIGTLTQILGNVSTTWLQQRTTQSIEVRKLEVETYKANLEVEKAKINLRQYDSQIQVAETGRLTFEAGLIKSALSQGDDKTRAAKVRFLVLSGLVRDPSNNIKHLKDSQFPAWQEEKSSSLTKKSDSR